jgi:hypothetical protein
MTDRPPRRRAIVGLVLVLIACVPLASCGGDAVAWLVLHRDPVPIPDPRTRTAPHGDPLREALT